LIWGTGKHRIGSMMGRMRACSQKLPHPGNFDFCPFFGVDRNSGGEQPNDSLVMPLCTKKDDKTVNSLDMSCFENYAQTHVPNRLANRLGQGFTYFEEYDAIGAENVEMED